MNEMKEAAVRQFLLAIGDNPQRAGLIDTPGRVIKANAEIFAHTGEKHFADYKLFDVDTDAEMVVLTDIPFYSMCEHHLLPFFGTATIAYQPKQHVIGLSKLPRLVEWAARRPSMQEELTTLIADELERILGAAGIGVHLSARHMCMEMRGINQPGTTTTSYVTRGSLKTDHGLRREFMEQVN
ncbi:GTP cyclohydrolase I [Weissella confusa]|uniref:GTP cyclohydrolase 1 n=1 Tax=Weissella confusa TaxID=1583 RepID=A0AAJ3DCE1_WEICO|nr:GTP cyclohydrolase I [Weissella confusa]NBA12403.1 GTP cyclohydrolase I FolE [Weissella confusa]